MADKAFGVDQLDILGTGTPTISAPNQLNLDCHTVAISTSVTVGANLTVNGNIDLGNASSDTISLTGVIDTNIIPSADSSKNIGSNTVRFANGYFDTVYGDGSNLTNLPASGISTSPSNVQATWKLGGGSGSGFTFTGPGQDGSEGNPDVYLVRGQRYLFDNTALAGNHPFEFRNAANDADYTDGVSGAQNGLQYINVQHDAPAQLKYRCTIHTNSMLGNIYIVGQHLANGTDNRVLTATSAYGMNGEANLTFNGTLLHAKGSGEILRLETTASGGGQCYIDFDDETATRASIGMRGSSSDTLTLAALNGSMRFDVQNKTQAMNIAADGKIGIGLVSPNTLLHIQDAAISGYGSQSSTLLVLEDTGDTSIEIASGHNSTGSIFFGDTGASNKGQINYLHGSGGDAMAFQTNGAERVRITSGGYLGINETSPQRYLHITGNDGTTGATSGNSDTQLVIENAGTNGAMIEFLSSNNGAGRIFFTDSGSSNQGGIEYLHNGDHFQVSAAAAAQGTMALHLRKNNAANNVQSDMIAFDVGASGRGKIVSAPSGSSSPQFSSYSDRRLKTNFRDYTGGYDRIKSIPVKLYDEVLNDQTKSVFGDNVKTDVIGWIADEVQSVFPESVRGTKDEVDSDGKPVYQSLTEGTFLPDAIQAIQKLIQKVETLETKVAALEGS